MANREGKALNMVSVSADYAGGIQEGEATPVYLAGGGAGIVDPTTEGNLLVQGAGGVIEDAGFAADVTGTAGSVVRRRPEGGVVVNAINNENGILCLSDSGFAALFGTVSGENSIAFVTPDPINVISGIDGVSGILRFYASAAANRNAQLTELFASIPTSDPLVAGQLWSNGGVVTISSG